MSLVTKGISADVSLKYVANGAVVVIVISMLRKSLLLLAVYLAERLKRPLSVMDATIIRMAAASALPVGNGDFQSVIEHVMLYSILYMCCDRNYDPVVTLAVAGWQQFVRGNRPTDIQNRPLRLVLYDN